MTSDPSSSQSQPVIHITHEQAHSQHVDDLLKRQMSLRGEMGIARDRQSRWYLQNWFIFMIVGGVSAFLAWAIIEPLFDDYIYMQGRIAAKDVPLPIEYSGTGLDLHAVMLDDTMILVPNPVPVVDNDKELDPTTLNNGEVVGFHMVWIGQDLGFAEVIETNPDPANNTDPTQTIDSLSARSTAASLLLFPLVASMIGLGLGAADGAVCRLVRRALLAGAIGLIVGFIGGFISSIVAGLAYAPLNALAMRQAGDGLGGLTTFGFIIQMAARVLGWALAGVAMGLGQGLALRSGRLIVYGLIGGILGGVIGGLMFDPIDLLLMGSNDASAHWSRMAAITVLGCTVGAMIGFVELLARDAWLCMTRGPLAGKEFLVFKDTMRMGSSPRSEIYLFNDPQVQPHHATLRSVGDVYELESLSPDATVSVNGRPVKRARLHHGDQIMLGDTLFTFNCKSRG